jgi:apoptosis-inducing factor 3
LLKHGFLHFFIIELFGLSGPAGAVCAETLRQEGFRGQIIVATKESHLPYDRPKLSKVLSD